MLLYLLHSELGFKVKVRHGFRVRLAYEVGECIISMKVLTNIIQPCVCVVYLIICSYRAFKKKPVPNPSKYFCTLQSLNEGNLKV